MDKKVPKCNFALMSMNPYKFLCGFELKGHGICTENECELWNFQRQQVQSENITRNRNNV